jgi:hypothetical protein
MAAGRVILYFDDPADALRFALAAGSVMCGERQARTAEKLIQETQRAIRVKLGDSFEPAVLPPAPEVAVTP